MSGWKGHTICPKSDLDRGNEGLLPMSSAEQVSAWWSSPQKPGVGAGTFDGMQKMFGHRQMAPWRVGVSGLWGFALIHSFTSDSLRGKVIEFAKHRKLSTCKCPYRRVGNCVSPSSRGRWGDGARSYFTLVFKITGQGQHGETWPLWQQLVLMQHL